jgi:hypothetical protein
MLSAGDTAYCYDPFNPAQIGQSFTLTLYMLFAGHSHRQEHVSAKDLTWQEVMYKCRVKLQRVPLFYDEEAGDNAGDKGLRAQSKIQEYCYELSLVEDLDDGRVHDMERGRPHPFEDVAQAGLRARIPVHQICKMFYTTSGKLLGIDESNSPILLIKRNENAPAPRKVLEKVRGYVYSDDGPDPGDYDPPMPHSPGPTHHGADHDTQQDLPKHLDPEWLAFEIFMDQPDDDSSATVSPVSSTASSRSSSPVPDASPPPTGLSADDTRLLSISLRELEMSTSARLTSAVAARRAAVRSDLSVLECLLRLTILQNYQQAQHTSVHDELLNLFLSDSSWSGSKEQRRVEREQARNKLGFDPFEATPGISERLEGQQGLAGGGTSGSKTARIVHLEGGSRDNTPVRKGMSPGLSPMVTPSIGAHRAERYGGSGRQGGNWVKWESPDSRSVRDEWTPDRQLIEGWENLASPLPDTR